MTSIRSTLAAIGLAATLATADAASAQNTIATDSEAGRKLIAAAEYSAGDCLIAGTGSIDPHADPERVDCDDDRATARIAEVVIDPFDCPKGTGRLMEYGPDNPTFCLEPLE